MERREVIGFLRKRLVDFIPHTQIQRQSGAKTKLILRVDCVRPGGADQVGIPSRLAELNGKAQQEVRGGVSTVLTGECEITVGPVDIGNVDLVPPGLASELERVLSA